MTDPAVQAAALITKEECWDNFWEIAARNNRAVMRRWATTEAATQARETDKA